MNWTSRTYRLEGQLKPDSRLIVQCDKIIKLTSSPSNRMERRLAAILAADVVGYSCLMEQNEADTFERLRAHRNE